MEAIIYITMIIRLTGWVKQGNRLKIQFFAITYIFQFNIIPEGLYNVFMYSCYFISKHANTVNIYMSNTDMKFRYVILTLSDLGGYLVDTRLNVNI